MRWYPPEPRWIALAGLCQFWCLQRTSMPTHDTASHADEHSKSPSPSSPDPARRHSTGLQNVLHHLQGASDGHSPLLQHKVTSFLLQSKYGKGVLNRQPCAINMLQHCTALFAVSTVAAGWCKTCYTGMPKNAIMHFAVDMSQRRYDARPPG